MYFLTQGYKEKSHLNNVQRINWKVPGQIRPHQWWFLFALANLASLRHDEIRQGQGLDLLVHPPYGLSIMLFATGTFLSQWDMKLPKPVLCFFLPCLLFLCLLQPTVLP